jgi:3-methyladenine DNA glycosylase Tag
LSSTIFENTKQQWTIQLDAAGVYPVTYTKNTTTRNGTPVYDDATLFEFLILETFGSAGLPS